MKASDEYIGYLKLDGQGVEDGKIDIAEASKFLAGIDNNLRFFIAKENPELSKVEYSLEVKIKQGSIEVILLGIVGIIGTAYLSGAAQQLAKNDIGDKTSADILKSAANKMKSTVKIAKHVGGIDKKKVEKVKFQDNNQIIGVPNSKGEYLYVKKEEFDAFFAAPKNLYESIVSPVSEDVSLSIAVKDEKDDLQEESISNDEKIYFAKNTDEHESNELILPELANGEFVELEGELSRVNGRTNTFGFFYEEHVITSVLREGNVKDHKQAILGKVRIKGEVTRHYKERATEEEKKKPKLILDEIKILEEESSQTKLL